jgi:preprotein translocase subunit SecY
MATRYLTLLLGAVQAYGIIKTMENSSYISLTMGDNFWTYAYIVTVLLAGACSPCGSATKSPRKA